MQGKNVVIKENVVIGENVIIEDNVYIDYGVIIRDNVTIKKNSYIGARCVLGEYCFDFFKNRVNNKHCLDIGENALIRSDSIIYGDVTIGDNFQSGHRVTIRENTNIGNNCRIGTNSDIQDGVVIGNYVNIHSDVFISKKNVIKDYVWIFPRVVFTNDPTPPSNNIAGSTVESFSSVAAGAIVLPGTKINRYVLVAAGAVIGGETEEGYVYVGVPAKKSKRVENIKDHVDGEDVYPWPKYFDRGMPWNKDNFDTWLSEQENEYVK